MRYLGKTVSDDDLITKGQTSPLIFEKTILDLGMLAFGSGDFQVNNASEIKAALKNHRAIHVLYGNTYDGYYVASGYVDGADTITLEFIFSQTIYDITIDVVSGGANVSTYNL